jgi:hypothetical protein
VADFIDWMINRFPPWTAYRAIMAGRLLALDKSPGVHPVEIRETWQQCFTKVFHLIAGGDAHEACGIDQLCAGPQAGIEGGIHTIRNLWDQCKAEEEWGFLLVDARITSFELNRMVMLWTIRHEWPAGAKFSFNSCYQHWVVCKRGVPP